MFQITNQIIWTLGMVHCHVWLPEGTSNVIRFRMITAILLTWDLLPPKSHDYIWKSSSCVGLGDPYQLHPKKKYYSEIRHVSTGSKYQNCCSFTTSCGSMLFTGWGQAMTGFPSNELLQIPQNLSRQHIQIWPDPRSVPSCFFLSEELDELEDDEDELEDELEEELFLSMGWVHGIVNRKPWLSLYHMF